jgi:hypothetical protein
MPCARARAGPGLPFALLLCLSVHTVISARHKGIIASEVAALINNFQAADATYQDWCVSMVRNANRTYATDPDQDPPSPGVAASQGGQDMFIWRNFFTKKAVRGEKGFYVDSGAKYTIRARTDSPAHACNLPATK